MNITVVLPIHEYSEEIETLLKVALDSVTKQEGFEETPEILLVTAFSIVDKIKKFLTENNYPTVKIVVNEGDTDFQSQINLGVSEVKTPYFSILEFDDELGLNYFKQAENHIKTFPDIEVFLPIVVETNDKNQAVKLTNNSVWSRQAVGDNGTMGYLNMNLLNEYTDFKICGAIIKKQDFDAVKGLKKNIIMTFQYEFFLRMINNGAKIYNIPKTMYKHIVVRPNSLFMTYQQTLSMQERKFWFEVAKKEYSFINDRVIDLSTLKTQE